MADQANISAAAGSAYKGLYKLGSVAALVIAVLLVGEIVVYAAFPRASTALEHFALFRENWLVGLLTLDLLGMIAYLLFIPTILALYFALRQVHFPMMAVATTLFLVGIAAFFASNTAFSMLTLSQQYAAAGTDAERAAFLAAGQAMLTLFNENAFLVSYVLVSAAWTMIVGVILRSRAFSRFTAWAGILAGGAGILAVLLEHVLASELILIAISLYFAAIVFLMIWVILVGRRLYKLAGPS